MSETKHCQLCDKETKDYSETIHGDILCNVCLYGGDGQVKA